MVDPTLLKLVAGIALFTAAVFGTVIMYIKQSAVGMFEEFEEAFPEQCAICAYHTYGIHNGHVAPGTIPNDHRCKEKWARWKGALHGHRN